jgi:hypothetical protein
MSNGGVAVDALASVFTLATRSDTLGLGQLENFGGYRGWRGEPWALPRARRRLGRSASGVLAATDGYRTRHLYTYAPT